MTGADGPIRAWPWRGPWRGPGGRPGGGPGSGPPGSKREADPLPRATPGDEEVLVRAERIGKEYATGRGRLVLFHDLDLLVRRGEMVAVVGQSGAGKSTLLHILGALDAPSSGRVYCASTYLDSLNANTAARFRNREIGYVWQFHYLLPEFTAQENVALPLMARGEGRSRALEQAAAWLAEVELSDRLEHRAGELSGGEQQRVSLARALVTEPRLLLADEPTGDLDGETAERIFTLIARLHRAHRLTSLLVTHNLELAERCTRVLRLAGGRLEELTAAD